MVWGRRCHMRGKVHSRTQPDAAPSANLGILYDVQIMAHLKLNHERTRDEQ